MAINDSIIKYTTATSGAVNFSATGQTLFLQSQYYNQNDSYFSLTIHAKTGGNDDTIQVQYSEDNATWINYDVLYHTVTAPAIALPWSQSWQPKAHNYWQIVLTLGANSTIQYSAEYNFVP